MMRKIVLDQTNVADAKVCPEETSNVSVVPDAPIVAESKHDLFVPENKLYGYDLKRLKSFRKIRKTYKMSNMKKTFINDLKIVLGEYSPQSLDNQLNHELLLELMNISEEYFFYGTKVERQENKRSSIIQLMLPYFRNDEILLTKTMSLIEHQVKKSCFRKRMYQRFKYFFFQK